MDQGLVLAKAGTPPLELHLQPLFSSLFLLHIKFSGLHTDRKQEVNTELPSTKC
jgi:hypothetical protein